MTHPDDCPPDKHINAALFTDEQLAQYQLAVQAVMRETVVYNDDCQQEWDKRYPPQ